MLMRAACLSGGKAAGVRLKGRGKDAHPDVVRATKAVVSNASVWDTQKLLPARVGAE